MSTCKFGEHHIAIEVVKAMSSGESHTLLTLCAVCVCFIFTMLIIIIIFNFGSELVISHGLVLTLDLWMKQFISLLANYSRSHADVGYKKDERDIDGFCHTYRNWMGSKV